MFDLSTQKEKFNKLLKGKDGTRNVVITYQEPEKLWYKKYCCDVKVSAPRSNITGVNSAITEVRKRYTTRLKNGNWWSASLKAVKLEDFEKIIEDLGELLPYPKKGIIKVEIFIPFSDTNYQKLKDMTDNSSGKIKQMNKTSLFKDKYEAKAIIGIKRRKIWELPENQRIDYFNREFEVLYSFFSNQKSSSEHEFTPQVISFYENKRSRVLNWYSIPMTFTLYLSKDQISYLSLINREFFEIDKVEVANV